KDELKNPMYATGLGLVLEGFRQYNDLDEADRRRFYPELFPVEEPVIPESVATETIITEPVMEEEEIMIEEPQQKVETTTVKRKGNFLKEMATVFQDWFKDERVNGDFDE
ncbi:MAG TPA: hypothetical protein VK174_08380, partial [Chitinophagales bacterium]|nr:hypothetical protein [Chitinophagales bacterium]